jgi:Fanconi-associated nuclease 1
MEYENELLSYIEAKEYEQAYEKLDCYVFEFKKQVLDPDLNEYDLKLPIYLRKFTSNCMLVKFLSIYANEILQKLKKYEEANDIFEFLLFQQSTYLLDSRAKWFERLALNLETHLKDSVRAYDILEKGLSDLKYVKKAGRLALFQRLLKMKQTKRYAKIKELSEKFKQNLHQIEKYDFIEAPTVEIEGTILHSEFIPGRKNVFIQNFEYDDEIEDQNSNESEKNYDGGESIKISSSSTGLNLIKNRYNLSVEEVALTHYIKKLDFTDGKHAETAILSTLYGLLFWDIIFEDKTVRNVFVDRFQSTPLDLQTDYFYLNRKNLIESRLDLLGNSPIGFICELMSNTWILNKDTECSLVSWSLFDSLEQLISLVRCFTSNQLTSLCRYMSENYRYCRSGGPDLIVWSTKSMKCKFVEVKGPGDRLSHKQMVWLDFLIRNSIECEVCHVKGTNQKRLRD